MNKDNSKNIIQHVISSLEAVKHNIRNTAGVCPYKLVVSWFSGKDAASALLSTKTPSLRDRRVKKLLADTQGNILKGHGRKHAVHLFLQFKPGEEKQARKWLGNFGSRHVTSALEQYARSEKFRSAGVDGGQFAHVALSSAGYWYLKIQVDNHPQPAKRSRDQMVLESDLDVFAHGAKERQLAMLDPQVSQWEPGFQKDIHALVILANDNVAALLKAESKLRKELAEIADICATEYGDALERTFTTESGTAIMNVEHFGFADGISQPVFFAEEIARAKECDNGLNRYDPSANLGLVLVKDPLGQYEFSCGSFLAFRKIEQNVAQFWQSVDARAQRLGLDSKLVAAMLIGRFEDGTPLVDSKAGGKENPLTNNFNYEADIKGLCCPFFSHARKCNPRGESVGTARGLDKTTEEERSHRIARRGIPYGGALSDFSNRASLPAHGKGLHFICYQSNIQRQFEFMMRRWLNNPYFVKPMKGEDDNYDSTGLDPVVGQKHPTTKFPASEPANWPRNWGESTVKDQPDATSPTTMLGGEYFFSPSISALRRLSSL